MKTIRIVGHPFNTSGYGIHCKNLALALSEYYDVVITGVPQVTSEQVMNEPKLYAMICKPQDKFDATIYISIPDYMNQYAYDNDKPFIPFCVFEGTKLPSVWIEKFNQERITHIFTPSQYVKQVAIESGITKDITIVPHGINPNVFKLEGETDAPNGNFRVNFCGGWKDGVKDRKGLDILLRAFTEEFKNHEKVELIVKLNTAYGTFEKAFKDIQDLQLKPANERAKITLIGDVLTEDKLAKLYRSCNVFVMPSKAEAFCMPVLEAQACGIPVICSAYGGMQEFALYQDLLIPTERMIPATGEPYHYEQAEWALPSQKHLQMLMRYTFENQEEMKMRGRNCAEHAKKFTWRESTLKAKSVIDGL